MQDESIANFTGNVQAHSSPKTTEDDVGAGLGRDAINEDDGYGLHLGNDNDGFLVDVDDALAHDFSNDGDIPWEYGAHDVSNMQSLLEPEGTCHEHFFSAFALVCCCRLNIHLINVFGYCCADDAVLGMTMRSPLKKKSKACEWFVMQCVVCMQLSMV